jgi:hypothetical protein
MKTKLPPSVLVCRQAAVALLVDLASGSCGAKHVPFVPGPLALRTRIGGHAIMTMCILNA